MASLNKVILIGNLGADPETRYTTSGDAVCNIRLATTDSWRDKASGEQREATEWHRVVFYRRLAEIAGQERYTTEVEATEMKMLGRREGQGEPVSRDDPFAPATAGGSNASRRPPANVADLDDDIPF